MERGISRQRERTGWEVVDRADKDKMNLDLDLSVGDGPVGDGLGEEVTAGHVDSRESRRPVSERQDRGLVEDEP